MGALEVRWREGYPVRSEYGSVVDKAMPFYTGSNIGGQDVNLS
jgi:hypothetical protein